MVLVVVAGGVAELIPMTTLAAILIVIGVEALVRELRHIAEARWVSRPHAVAAVVTVVVGVVSELTTAIFTGVALSMLLYLVSVGDRATVHSWRRREDGTWEEAAVPPVLPTGQVTVLAVSGQAFFASVSRADQALPDPSRSSGRPWSSSCATGCSTP